MHRYLAIVLAVSISSTALGEEIPLKSIWAYNMPGTQDLATLDDGQARGFLIDPIRKTLGKVSKSPDAGFLVQGVGLEALRNFYQVRVGGEEARTTFPAGDDLSLAFFSYHSSPYVHLHKVERKGNEIIVRYRFAPHESRELSEHFALIPLQDLKPGEYSVSVAQSPMAKMYIDQGFSPIPESLGKKIVCKPFSFKITKQ